MNFIIGILVGAKSIALIAGMIAFGTSDITISPPKLVLTPNEIQLSCRLENGYTRDLRKLSQTGTEIIVYLFVEVKEEDSRELVAKVSSEHTLFYNMLDKEYVVYRQENDAKETFGELDSALAVVSTFTSVPVVSIHKIEATGDYFFEIYSILGKTKIEALDDKEIDLMYYWDYKRPSVRTETFKGSVLLYGK
ncbi:MAG: DUF4390 domain-containing protein [Chitinivibrionales bacterium]|nr:DUF4390 domain-containing protein [Chitinivibrionales bacterium]